MKHLPADQPPPAYAQWVAANPNATWEELRDAAQGQVYAVLREALIHHQQGLCAFCEIDLLPSDQEIEHWHPKFDRAGAVNWALLFSNLQAACLGGFSQAHPTVEMQRGQRYLEPVKDNLSCGAKKGKLYPEGVLLHPRDVPITPAIFFVDFEGRLHVHEGNSRRAGVDTECARRTIGMLGLRSRAKITVTVSEIFYSSIRHEMRPGSSARLAFLPWRF